jgi:hypothetical protein
MIGTTIAVISAYYSIGIGIKILNEDGTETKDAVTKVMKNASYWPKDLYNKFKKDNKDDK